MNTECSGAVFQFEDFALYWIKFYIWFQRNPKSKMNNKIQNRRKSFISMMYFTGVGINLQRMPDRYLFCLYSPSFRRNRAKDGAFY